MTLNSKDFYASLKPFSRFSDLTEAAHYLPVPSDWWVVITDVKGSTEALAQNRYKDVNLLGASSIISVLNILPGVDVPFVFGGDGATMLIHESDIERIKPALRGTQRLARDVLDFELRVGMVPIAMLAGSGTSVQVAKFAISKQTSIAMIRGGGLNYVEKLVKDTTDVGASFRLALGESALDESASFEGLSCRWNPIKAKRGEMMSLLIVALRQEKSEVIYKRIIAKIESILDPSMSRPTTGEMAGRRTHIPSLLREFRMQTMGKSLKDKMKCAYSILFQVAVMRGFMLTGLKSKSFDATKYFGEMGDNSDFQKFDDMIRMVRDCTAKQRDEVLNALAEERAKGEIAYGVHMSNEALLTCLVFQLDNHIHFVDGSGGGYALAAKQLKEQLKESAGTKTGASVS